MDCIFCKIANKEIPSKLAYEDDDVYGFYDIEPCAPVHILVVPKKHIQSISHIQEDDLEIIGKIHLAIGKIAKEQKIDITGYRVVSNIGEQGGQSVLHLHYHIIGGRNLSWPPG